ncbi:alpha/beta fold hydrolase [soil metagenome]
MDAYFDDHVIRIGRGEPLLLIHGLGHCKEGWEPVLPGLGGRFDVAAIDLPGFNGAPELPVTPTDGALTDWCERVLDELGWETAHIAGNSLGGLIGLRLGGRGRARSVTAISPGGQTIGWEHRYQRVILRTLSALGPRLARIPAVSDTALGRTLAMKVVFGKPERMTPGYARASLEALRKETAFKATLDAVEWQVADVKPIDAPVTIAWGSRDFLLLPRQGPRWVAELPGSRLVRLPGLGHTPMPDDPGMIVDVISRTAAASAAS